MPKDTFFNLPESKRRRIEAAMIDEFAQFGYRGARINRIVAQSGIAKGSFYQYFDGKADMLGHVTKLIGEEKIQYLTPVLQNPDGHSVFEIFREVYDAGIRFALRNPKMIAIGNDILNNRDDPDLKRIFSDSNDLAVQYYRNLLESAQRRGELRGGLNLDFTAHLLAVMNAASVEYCLREQGRTDMDISKIDDRLPGVVDMLIGILKNGIAAGAEEQDD